MFIENKYSKCYFSIIGNATKTQRNYDSQKHEYHHIIPKSLGGTDEENNIVILTFREHYICHALLIRMTRGKDKMKMCFALHAFFHMNQRNRAFKSSHLYNSHSKIIAQAFKDRIPWKKPGSYRFKNIETGEEIEMTRNEFVNYTGVNHQNLYHLINNRYKKGTWQSCGWGIWDDKLNMYSHEKPKKFVPHTRLTCEHCGKSTNGGNYKRWHGSNCKSIRSS